MRTMTGIGDIFEREKRIGDRVVRVVDFVFVFAQLGPEPLSRPQQFVRPNLACEYPAWNTPHARMSLDRAIKHHAKGWINNKELAFVERRCQDALLKAAEIVALRAKEAQDKTE